MTTWQRPLPTALVGCFISLGAAAGGADAPDVKVMSYNVRYAPVDEGHDGVSFEVQSSAHALNVPIHGAGTLSNKRTDTWQQRERDAVDVLFVVDNSGSMMEEQQAYSAVSTIMKARSDASLTAIRNFK